MEKDSFSLLHGPVRPALLRYALPILLSMVATQLYTVADTMIIGLKLDSSALAAVSNASTVLLVFLFVSGGLELGGGLLAAARKPTASPQEMSDLGYNLLFVDLAVALALTAAGGLGMEACLRLIHTPAEVLDQAVLYGRVYLLGLPFLMVYDLSKQVLTGCGDTLTPLLAVVFTSVLNVVLDLALVGPFGVAGAAGATAFSQLVGAVFMLWKLHRTLLAGPFSPKALRLAWLWEILRLSAPSTLQQASVTLVLLARQSLLSGLGVAAIAGFSCAGRLSSLLQMPIFGFVQSVVFFVAQNTAAAQPERVAQGLREGRRILLGYSLLMAAASIGLARPMLRLFTTDLTAIQFGARLLRWQGPTWVLTAQRHLLEGRLRGRQQMARYLVSNIGQLLLEIGLLFVLVPRIGFDGFWLSTWICAPAGLLLAWGLSRG